MVRLITRAAMMFDFVAKAGTIDDNERGFYDSLMPAARRTASRQALATMHFLLQSITQHRSGIDRSQAGSANVHSANDGHLQASDEPISEARKGRQRLRQASHTRLLPKAKWLRLQLGKKTGRQHDVLSQGL